MPKLTVCRSDKEERVFEFEAGVVTIGRAESNSIKIIQSPNPGFDQPSRTWIQHALFRPARVHGRAVRVLVQVPLDYRITGK